MNLNFDLDILIFVVFLLVNFVLGLRYGRGVKNIKGYALGDRNFTTGALVATIVATYASGSGFFTTISNTYSDGLYYFTYSFFFAFQLVIYAYIFIPRMKYFLGKTSVAEAMGYYYGQNVRIITAICGSIGAVGFIAVQYRVFGNLFSYFIGLQSEVAIILAGITVTCYSAFGGIRAVTMTDVFQFITFGIIIPVIGILIWNELRFVEGFSMSNAFSDPKFDYSIVYDLSNPSLWNIVPLCLYFLMPAIQPPIVQRISMANNLKQIKLAFLISSVMLFLVKLSIAWIPFLVYSVDPTISKAELIPYIIDNYTYTGFKGLMIVGVTALAMSTADSYINSASVLFVHDVCIPLKIKRSNELVLSRVFSFILGIGGIWLALYSGDLLSIVLIADNFYMPVITVPLMLMILGFRTSTKSVLISMVAGGVTILIWELSHIKANGIVFSMVINLLFLFGSHYLLKQPGGWVKNEDKDDERFSMISYITQKYEFWKGFNFINFCKKYAPNNELSYSAFGGYCVIYSFTTIYYTHGVIAGDTNFVIVIYQIMMCTGVVLCMYPILPLRMKYNSFMQVSWHFIVFYMLIVFSGFFVMISGFFPLQFVVFTMNIIIAGILVGWRMSIGMLFVGFFLSFQLYKFYLGVDDVDLGFSSPLFVIMYSLLLLTASIVLFVKPKQQLHELIEEKNEHLNGRIDLREKELHGALNIKNEFIRNVSHEYHAPMTGITSMAQVLFESYNKLNDSQRHSAIEDILKSSRRLDVFDSNISSLSMLSNSNYKLHYDVINFGDLVKERVKLCRKLYEEDNYGGRNFIIKISPNLNITVDKRYITQTLDNLIMNAISYCNHGDIIVTLENKNDEILFSISDEGIGIPKSEIYDIFGEFVVSSRTYTPSGGRGVGLALCKRVVELHNGVIWATSDGKKGSTFYFTLPINQDSVDKVS